MFNLPSHINIMISLQAATNIMFAPTQTLVYMQTCKGPSGVMHACRLGSRSSYVYSVVPCQQQLLSRSRSLHAASSEASTSEASHWYSRACNVAA